MPLELLGPLGCGIQTGAGTVFNVMAPPSSASIAVFGGGAVGLSAILAAASLGCVRIALVDPMPARRQAALELGATEVYDSADPDIAQAMTASQGGFDLTLATSGAPSAISTAIGVTRTRGECVLVGSPSVPGQTFPIRTGLFVQKGITLRGVMEGDASPRQFIPLLLQLQAEGKFPFERLLKTYRFDQINEAVADQAAGLCIKPVLVM